MSNIEPNEQFVTDEEFSSLLRTWHAPDPSSALDERVSASFLSEMKETRNPGLLPQTNKEVVAMKFCSTCQERFADKFSFCPVDGTPLNAVVAES